MTRLKINVEAADDADALFVLTRLYKQMACHVASGRVRIDDANALVSYAFGNATAEVERDDAEEKRDMFRYEYIEQDHMLFIPSPKTGWELWRRHDAPNGLVSKYVWRRLRPHEARKGVAK